MSKAKAVAAIRNGGSPQGTWPSLLRTFAQLIQLGEFPEDETWEAEHRIWAANWGGRRTPKPAAVEIAERIYDRYALVCEMVGDGRHTEPLCYYPFTDSSVDRSFEQAAEALGQPDEADVIGWDLRYQRWEDGSYLAFLRHPEALYRWRQVTWEEFGQARAWEAGDGPRPTFDGPCEVEDGEGGEAELEVVGPALERAKREQEAQLRAFLSSRRMDQSQPVRAEGGDLASVLDLVPDQSTVADW